MAIWGESIFDEIRSLEKRALPVPLLDHLRTYSLSDHISACLADAKVTTQEINESREIVMQAFDPFKGVELKKVLVTSQKRISDAVNKSNELLTFYPSSVVTPTVFEALEQ